MSSVSGSRNSRTAWIASSSPIESVTAPGMLNTGTRLCRGNSGEASIAAPCRGSGSLGKSRRSSEANGRGPAVGPIAFGRRRRTGSPTGGEGPNAAAEDKVGRSRPWTAPDIVEGRVAVPVPSGYPLVAPRRFRGASGCRRRHCARDGRSPSRRGVLSVPRLGGRDRRFPSGHGTDRETTMTDAAGHDPAGTTARDLAAIRRPAAPSARQGGSGYRGAEDDRPERAASEAAARRAGIPDRAARRVRRDAVSARFGRPQPRGCARIDPGMNNRRLESGHR